MAAIVVVKYLAAHELYKAQDEGVGAGDDSVAKEQKERLHVVQTDAFADPDTVVVHADDTAIALRTMMRAHRLHCHAMLTHFAKNLMQQLSLAIREVTY